MSKQYIEGNFINDGFVIIRKAIDAKVIEEFQNIIVNELDKKKKIKKKKIYDQFCESLNKSLKTKSTFDIQRPIYQRLVYEQLIQKYLKQKSIYNKVSDILGKDLAFAVDAVLSINLPNRTSPEKNYLFKEYHQEMWSGVDIHTLQTWTPIFQNSTKGQIKVIKSSHEWGHIPHRNRKPSTELPKNHEEVEIELELGDVTIFHSLLLHASIPLGKNDKPRMSLVCPVKNFLKKNEAFSHFGNWKIFSYSDLSIIDRKLGNHYLSPFRLTDIASHGFTKEIDE